MSWLTLPELIFTDVMLMVGLGSLESLHRCRQVCSKWNESIMVHIWGNPSKKKVMKEKIEQSWAPEIGMFPSDEEISHAKWLAVACTMFYIERSGSQVVYRWGECLCLF